MTHKGAEVDVFALDGPDAGTARHLATTPLGEQLEGCVFDEDYGTITVGREETGISRFRVGPVATIDGAEETDGIDAISAPLPGFPAGLLVVQDGYNDADAGGQNFKYVDWRDVARALSLD